MVDYFSLLNSGNFTNVIRLFFKKTKQNNVPLLAGCVDPVYIGFSRFKPIVCVTAQQRWRPRPHHSGE